MLTRRAFALALLIPALLLLGALIPAAAVLALIYAAMLLWAVGLDRRSAGTVEQFRVERQHDEKLSLGARNRIAIQVESRAPRPVEVTIRDEPPLLFSGSESAQVSGTVGPLDSAEFEYHLRPLKRGDYTFGNLNIRWSSPLGLYTRQAVIPAAREVQVYPDLHEIRKYDLLVRRDQLAEMGLRSVRLRGEGTAYESLRDYTPDDPYRSINWKATARRGRPISTDYEPERSQRVMIALDAGRMMRSPIRMQDADGSIWDMAKVDFVVNSVLLFSYVAALKGDQVGLLVFADRVIKYIAPGGGQSQFHKLLRALYGLESQPVEADYAAALSYLRSASRKRSLVVLFTDLSGLRAADALATYMPPLAPQHLPLVVTIRDPALDFEAAQIPHDSASTYRRAVAEQLIDERRRLLGSLAQRGVLTLDVDAQHMTMAVVNRYLQLKARSRL
jgi:uncharacterized protein (DUF58 family)